MTQASLPYLALIMSLTLPLCLTAQSDLGSFGSSSDSTDNDSESDTQKENEVDTEHPLVDRIIGYYENPDESNGTKRGIIYARVSSQAQEDNFNSLSNQVDRSVENVSNFDMELIDPPAKDGGESGQDFDRPQIQRVKRLAEEGKISYVVVDRLNRIGRDAQKSFEFVSNLRQNGVLLVTYVHGILDIDKPSHMLVCAHGLMSADEVVQSGSQRRNDGRRRGFKNKNWASKTSKAPFGYRIGPNGWLKKVEDEVEVLKQAFDVFLGVQVDGAYARTVENVPGLGNHDISPEDLRRIAWRPVYIGEPTYGVTSEKVRHRLEEPVIVPDEDLRIVSDEKFRRCLDKRDKVIEHHSNGKSESADVTDAVEVCGPSIVERATAEVKIHCRKPRCDTAMNHDGLRELNGEQVQQYVCPECGSKCRYPRTRDIDEILNYLSDFHPKLREFLDDK